MTIFAPSRPRASAPRVRPRWRSLPKEAALVALGYLAYTFVRDMQVEHYKPAMDNAHAVFDIEHPLGLTWIEHRLNNLVAGHHWLGLATGYYYSIMHMVVTVGVLVWLFLLHPRDYRPLRTALVLASLLGLFCFWQFPLAPPRLVGGEGYTDVIEQVRVWGSWSSQTIKDASDQYAAMPSLHTAWAVWCGWVLATRSRIRWVRIAGVLYPCATVFVIVSTANHYVVDAIAGAALMGLSLVVAPALVGWTSRSVAKLRPAERLPR